MHATDATYPLIMLVLGFIGRDIVPWCGARLVDMAKWAAPRVDRVLDAMLAAKPAADKTATDSQPAIEPATETNSDAAKEASVTKG